MCITLGLAVLGIKPRASAYSENILPMRGTLVLKLDFLTGVGESQILAWPSLLPLLEQFPFLVTTSSSPGLNPQASWRELPEGFLSPEKSGNELLPGKDKFRSGPTRKQAHTWETRDRLVGKTELRLVKAI